MGAAGRRAAAALRVEKGDHHRPHAHRLPRIVSLLPLLLEGPFVSDAQLPHMRTPLLLPPLPSLTLLTLLLLLLLLLLPS